MQLANDVIEAGKALKGIGTLRKKREEIASQNWDTEEEDSPTLASRGFVA